MNNKIEAYVKKQGACFQNKVSQNGRQNQEDLKVKWGGINLTHFNRNLYLSFQSVKLEHYDLKDLIRKVLNTLCFHLE